MLEGKLSSNDNLGKRKHIGKTDKICSENIESYPGKTLIDQKHDDTSDNTKNNTFYNPYLAHFIQLNSNIFNKMKQSAKEASINYYIIKNFSKFYNDQYNYILNINKISTSIILHFLELQKKCSALNNQILQNVISNLKQINKNKKD